MIDEIDLNASVKYIVSEIQKEIYHLMEEYPLPWVEYAYRNALTDYEAKINIVDSYSIKDE